MTYELTEHARDALEKRKIELAWVERVFDTPKATEADPVDPDLEHRLARIPEWGQSRAPCYSQRKDNAAADRDDIF